MDPIIRAAVVSSVPRQLRGAAARIEAAHGTPAAARSAQGRPAAVAPAQAPQLTREERQAHDAALQELAAQKAQLLDAQKKLEHETAALLADAERRGLAQGQEKGEQQALALVARQVGLLTTMAAALEAARRTVLEDAEDMLVEIAYAAVCRAVGATAATRETLLLLVRDIAREEHPTQQLCVRLHPQDMELLQAGGAPGEPGLDARITLQADSAVEIGGCMVDSAKGTLDARLETQLARLADVLLAVRRGSAPAA